MDEDEKRAALLEQGREVGRAIQARIQANRPPKRRFPQRQSRLPDDWGTSTQLALGYWLWMHEHDAILRDRKQAERAATRRSRREQFLAMVERALQFETDEIVRSMLEAERRKVWRALGMNKPTAETIREQTRLRVQKHRARARAEKALKIA